MGNFGKSLSAYIQAYRKVLKISVIVVLVISIILIVAGATLVGLNRSFFDVDLDAPFDENEAAATKTFAGLALLVTGFALLLVAACMGCTILECGIFGKLVEKGDN